MIAGLAIDEESNMVVKQDVMVPGTVSAGVGLGVAIDEPWMQTACPGWMERTGPWLYDDTDDDDGDDDEDFDDEDDLDGDDELDDEEDEDFLDDEDESLDEDGNLDDDEADDEDDDL